MRVFQLTCLAALTFSSVFAKFDKNHNEWKKTTKLFIFGDSYSSTGFSAIDPSQPSEKNPLGNPPKPDTTSGGPNWVSLLTTKYKAGKTLAYNFASDGATVSTGLVTQGLIQPKAPASSLREQYATFHSLYSKPAKDKAFWHTSLFVIWIGMDEILSLPVGKELNAPEILDNAIKEYGEVVRLLHKAGARRFLFINVPRVHETPLISRQPKQTRLVMLKRMEEFNNDLGTIIWPYSVKHDTRVWFLDAHNIFANVMENPTTYKETGMYTDTQSACLQQPAKGPPCTGYLWRDPSHPTVPMHDLLASKIATLMSTDKSWWSHKKGGAASKLRLGQGWF